MKCYERESRRRLKYDSKNEIQMQLQQNREGRSDVGNSTNFRARGFDAVASRFRDAVARNRSTGMQFHTVCAFVTFCAGIFVSGTSVSGPAITPATYIAVRSFEKASNFRMNAFRHLTDVVGTINGLMPLEVGRTLDIACASSRG